MALLRAHILLVLVLVAQLVIVIYAMELAKELETCHLERNIEAKGLSCERAI